MLNEWGFSCVAIDQRSGGGVNGIRNETAAYAKQNKLPDSYLDAEVDITSVLNYLHKEFGQQVVLVGSSYSASLVLKIGTESESVWGVASFSPGEYFGDKLFVSETVKRLNIPVFITSSRSEEMQSGQIFRAIASDEKVHFVPDVEGQHGSRAMWSKNEGHEGYRKAFREFMLQFLGD